MAGTTSKHCDAGRIALTTYHMDQWLAVTVVLFVVMVANGATGMRVGKFPLLMPNVTPYRVSVRVDNDEAR